MRIIKLLYICHSGSDAQLEIPLNQRGWKVTMCDSSPSDLAGAVVDQGLGLVLVDLDSLGEDLGKGVLSLVKKREEGPLPHSLGCWPLTRVLKSGVIS